MNLMRRCHECSQPLGKKDIFCPRCGAKQPRDPKKQSMDRIKEALHKSEIVTPANAGVQ